MDFNKYQKLSRKTAIYPRHSKNWIVYPVLGLLSESGEIAGKFKKILRDQKWKITPDHKKEISKELGDVLWYIAQMATELGLDLAKIAEENIAKLFSRKKRGVISGSGDSR